LAQVSSQDRAGPDGRWRAPFRCRCCGSASLPERSMPDSWNTWELSDPRKASAVHPALLHLSDDVTKRRRLDNGATAAGASLVNGIAGGCSPASFGTPADDACITERIVSALKDHIGNPEPASGTILPAAHPPSSHPTGEPELGAALLDSLRTLLPSGEADAACRSSEAGQELFRVVQGFASPAQQQQHRQRQQQPPILPDGGARPPPLALLDSDTLPGTASDGEPIRLPPPQFGALPSVPPVPFNTFPRALQEDDASDSDEGVPHRLPPGFGAIPEDIVEERARQREEERILRLKATQPCRFSRRCKRRDCPNAHPEGRDIDTSLNPCAFGRRCKRKGCFYDHPEGRVTDDDPTKGMCKFGQRCSRPDCLYDHPEGRAPLVGPDPRICYFCHDVGHIAGDCTRNPESWNFKRADGTTDAPGAAASAGAAGGTNSAIQLQPPPKALPAPA